MLLYVYMIELLVDASVVNKMRSFLFACRCVLTTKMSV